MGRMPPFFLGDIEQVEIETLKSLLVGDNDSQRDELL